MPNHHIPVLHQEAIDALNIHPEGAYLDATAGRGGHAQSILSRLGAKGSLSLLDRDQQAIDYLTEKFRNDSRVQVHHIDFASIDKVYNKGACLDGVFLDLGVSSPQLDQIDRGFSFQHDAKLDMRMDDTQGRSAQQWLADVEESELVKVFFEYGEEKFARRIAKNIILHREQSAIETTQQLVAIIVESVPKKPQKKHPATRVFQAIRIQVNQELWQLQQVLPKAMRLLKPNGRLAVISFHSLEDRIVKRFMRHFSRPNLPPRSIPIVEDSCYQRPLELIGKPIKPALTQIHDNPRCRSSVLRIAKRTPHAISTG